MMERAEVPANQELPVLPGIEEKLVIQEMPVLPAFLLTCGLIVPL